MSTLDHLPEVPVADWLTTAGRLHDQGYAVFDLLAGWEDPGGGGLRVVLQVLSPADAGSAGARTLVPHGIPLPSLTPHYAGAAWPERELAELFGLALEGFRDDAGDAVRPLYGSGPQGARVGMPLRKDVQLTARVETPWPGAR